MDREKLNHPWHQQGNRCVISAFSQALFMTGLIRLHRSQHDAVKIEILETKEWKMAYLEAF